MPCQTTIESAAQLKNHLSLRTHKHALRAACGAEGGAPLPAGSQLPAYAASTVAQSQALLVVPAEPAQAALRERYTSSPWPASPTAPHLGPVPGLPVHTGQWGCFACRRAASTAKALTKVHEAPAVADGELCTNTDFSDGLAVQSLKRGNRCAKFPVTTAAAPLGPSAAPVMALPTGAAAVATAGSSSAASPTRGAAPPSVALLPLDTFLGTAPAGSQRSGIGGGGAGGGSRASPSAGRLTVSESTADSQSGGLLQIYRFNDALKDMHWTAVSVMQRYGLFMPSPGPVVYRGDLEHGKARLPVFGWFFFACLKAAVLWLYRDAIKYLRGCDNVIASRLRIGQTAGDMRQRPFNIRITEPSLVKYARDEAVLLYVAQDIAGLGQLSAAEALEAGHDVPSLSPAAVQAIQDLREAYQAHASTVLYNVRRQRRRQSAGGGASSGSGAGVVSEDEDDATKLARVLLVPHVSALMRVLHHERYDSRPARVGGQGKTRCDIGLVMPFLSVVYPSCVTALSPAQQAHGGGFDAREAARMAKYLDATGAQHLAGALLFGTHIVNARAFMDIESESVEASFKLIQDATDPSSTTAAAYIVQLYAHGESIGRAEAVAPAFLPCDEPEHLAGAPEEAMCGSLLSQGLHLSTITLVTGWPTCSASPWRK